MDNHDQDGPDWLEKWANEHGLHFDTRLRRADTPCRTFRAERRLKKAS